MLHIHRSACADSLVGELARVLEHPAEDPFAPEIVAVPAKGVERWLAQRMSAVLGARGTGAGICANVLFPAPEQLLDAALAAAGPDPAAEDPWEPERAVWPLMAVMDAAGGRPADRVRAGDRRYAMAARLAVIFAGYAAERPGMLRRWAEGADTTDDDRPLPADLAWQPDIWRRLRAAIGQPSPAEMLPEALARLGREPELVNLPERFSVFGMNRLAAARLQVLAAVAEHREVHLWINHASPAMWDAVRNGRPPSHPMLASMARDVQYLQRGLLALESRLVDQVHPAPPRPRTLLGRLQEALSADRVAPPGERPALEPSDASVAVHACHGRLRQVEVLRDAVLARLAADPTLQPRDVIVMCPDIEEFAPLVAGVFGRHEHQPTGGLRVRLADRAPQAANPLFATASTILRLAAGRVGASEVLDLAGTEPVRHRFGFDAEATARLAEWVAGARICWGLDAEHRGRYGLGAIEAGTLREGMDRLLLGATMDAEAGWLAEALPCDEVDSAEIELLGRFAEFVDRLATALAGCARRQSVGEWAGLLARSVASLAEPAQPWQGAAFGAELAGLADSVAEHEVALSLADFAALWSRRTAGRPSRASFRSGAMTVCTMVPMRSVPHRVVALLGMDDGVFPRGDVIDGDDLLARAPRPGERDPRLEDRQLLLDAVCAAGDHLMIFFTGADERTGAAVLPAVPLGELLDCLDLVAVAPGAGRVRDEVTIRHPLQAFDPRNFGVGSPPGTSSRRPVSFDGRSASAAAALLKPRAEPPALIDRPLPGLSPGEVRLSDLRAVLTHPARAFLALRLGIRLSAAAIEPQDELPVQVDALQEWSIGERFLTARLRDQTVERCLESERRRGTLPPGALGHAAAVRIGRTAEAICLVGRAHSAAEPRSYDISVGVDVGGTPRPLVGTVNAVHGSDLLRVSYSKLGARHLLAAWLDLLALTLAHPDVGWRAVVIGRDRRDASRRMLGPLPADAAGGTLAELIELADAGLCEPLPIPPRTAHAYATAIARGMHADNAMRAAEAAWRTGEGEEASDAANVLVWGPGANLDDLGPARLAELAIRVWNPILAAGGGVSR